MALRHCQWARRVPACLSCGTQDCPHQARGFCHRCYGSRYRADALPGTMRHFDAWRCEEDLRLEAEADDAYLRHITMGMEVTV